MAALELALETEDEEKIAKASAALDNADPRHIGQEQVAALQERAAGAAQARAGEPLGARQRPLTLGEVTSMHSASLSTRSPSPLESEHHKPSP
jgi:hypothetical protein